MGETQANRSDFDYINPTIFTKPSTRLIIVVSRVQVPLPLHKLVFPWDPRRSVASAQSREVFLGSRIFPRDTRKDK